MLRHSRALARRFLSDQARLNLRRAPSLLTWQVKQRLSTEPGVVDVHPYVVCTRTSPLRRPGTTYDDELQHAKETNVTLAAAGVDRATLAPGARLSFQDLVGPPLRRRGFLPGPELHREQMAVGVGGGLCQVANMLLWLAVHADLLIVERHRHGVDLFPDAGRDVPFGLGATVFFPTKDLVIQNRGAASLQVGMRIKDGLLSGEIRASEPSATEVTVLELDHQFLRGEDGAVWRYNRLVRQRQRADVVEEEPLWENHARVCYEVDLP